MPKHKNGQFDKDRIAQLFSASPWYEWAPFAETQGWDPRKTYHEVPAAEWVADKVAAFQFLQSQKLRHVVFMTKSEYEKNVVDALRTLPQIADVGAEIFLEAAKQFRERQRAPKLKDRPKTFEVVAMVQAASQVIDMKQRSLLMNKFNIDILKRDTLTPPAPPATHNEKSVTEEAFTVEIMGAEKMKGRDIQMLMMKYIDQMKDVTPPAEGEVQKPVDTKED